ncbi:MAG: hypothetical protein ACI8Q1_002708 [Parvicella sp.]|jgi:hypothetical protein
MKQSKNRISITLGTLFKIFGLLIVIRMVFRNFFSETFGIIYMMAIILVGALAYGKAIREKKDDNQINEDELLDE